MDIIAKKKKQEYYTHGLVAGIVIIIVGVLILLFLMITHNFPTDDMSTNLEYVSIIVLIVGFGLLVLILCAILRWKYYSLPDELIAYKNGQLVFADGYSCKPLDIVKVKYRRGRDVRFIKLNDGTLTVYTSKKTIKYKFVENVEGAHNKLIYYIKRVRGELTY